MKLFVFSVFVSILITESYAKPKQLITLNEDSWSRMLQGEWMIEFFAPWCPACKSLQPVWEDFSSWSSDLGINVAQVDVTNSPGLSGRFMVNALPTIFHVKDGRFRQYRGSRDKEEFITFIEEKKWEKLEEVSWWKSPASIQMSLVSYFFKLSMVLRSVHNKFVEEYKFPFWASLLIFAVGTILIGVVLGLILVCIVDLLFPPKSVPMLPKSSKKYTEQSSETEEKLQQNRNISASEETLVDSSDRENSDLGKSDTSEGDNLRKRKSAKSTDGESSKNK